MEENPVSGRKTKKHEYRIRFDDNGAVLLCTAPFLFGGVE